MSAQLKASLDQETKKRTVVDIGNGISCGGTSLLIIAGPCSVESEEQMELVGSALLGTGVSALRGGVYKPRTSPYSFQGLGQEGLNLLAKISRKYSMPVITEVMSEKQVDAAVLAADVLQIGSRNMQNFELLKYVGTLNKPVILKRGLCATLDELVLAAEYILKGGNENVILCERGIRSYDNATRNVLDLGGVVALRQMTHLPIIVDPSHACGRSELIADLARAAIACGADGLMIECHPEPEKSVSDARQAISLEEMIDILHSLEPIARAVGRTLCSPHVVRSSAQDLIESEDVKLNAGHRHGLRTEHVSGYEALISELRSLRSEIDAADIQIAELLEKRLKLALQVGDLKQELKVPCRDIAREREVIESISMLCSDKRVAGKIRHIYERIIEASRQVQMENSLPSQVVA